MKVIMENEIKSMCFVLRGVLVFMVNLAADGRQFLADQWGIVNVIG
jgi:hypothetical protein